MRITNSMMVNQFLSESNDALGRVSKYQSQVDSTKRISGIADDPQATLTALRSRNRLSNLDLYKSNISTASSYLKEAESATNELNEILQSAYEDVMSASSGSKTPDDLATLAEDLQNLQDEVLNISNSTMGTSYLFGGYNYTGTVSGGVKKPPFTVDSTTGDLYYNGVNMSTFAWNDEYATHTSQMSSNAATITDAATKYASESSDDYKKSDAQSAYNALTTLLTNAKSSLNDAKEIGLEGVSSYTDFETFYNDLSTAATALNTQLTQEPFDASATQTALNDVASFFTGTTSVMSSAVTGLQGDFKTKVDAVQTDLDNEKNKNTTLQIGTSQSVDVTLTGLDLLGTGAGNIYHVLGKAVSLLKSGASADQLSSLVTTVQSAQSSVLTAETKIGASQNRLTLISNRYDTSEVNYTEMKSNAEDADMAESIMNLTTAQTVYNAALAGGSEILKTSLIDFLK